MSGQSVYIENHSEDGDIYLRTNLAGTIIEMVQLDSTRRITFVWQNEGLMVGSTENFQIWIEGGER